MSALLAWLAFAGCAASIAIAGSVLCRQADRIALATGLSRGWVGVLMLATVTSLPELATGVSASAFARLPDIAVGNVLGSCIFNLGMLGAVGLVARPALEAAAWIDLRRTAVLGVLLLGIPAGVLAVGDPATGLAVGSIGVFTPVILVAYLAAMRMGSVAVVPAPREPSPRLPADLARFALAAAVVATAGTALPFVAGRLAELMGWPHTFMGALFVAAATTLPELAVTVSAARMGAFDLAIGNLLGSNLFNVAILAVDDAVYSPGPILADASPALATTAGLALLMALAAVAPPSRIMGALLVCLYGASALLASRG